MKVNISIIAEIIHSLIFFCLNSFLVSENLNKYTIKNNVSINNSIEKIIVTACHINALISFRLIHNEAKNLTSSIVFAFITMKLINQPHITNAINAIAHKNVKISLKEVFLASFFTTFFSICLAFRNSFDHRFDGTTFVVNL